MKNFDKNLYKYRGFILGIFAATMLCMPYKNLNIYSYLTFFLIFIFAAFIRISARRSIGEHTRKKNHDADFLVTSGMYSRMRHPLYFSNFLFAIAFIILHFGFNILALPFIIVVLIFENKLASIEDEFLKKRFGIAWENWAKNVHKFMMNFSCKNIGFKRSAKEAFFADASTWFWLIICILFIIMRKHF